MATLQASRNAHILPWLLGFRAGLRLALGRDLLFLRWFLIKTIPGLPAGRVAIYRDAGVEAIMFPVLPLPVLPE